MVTTKDLAKICRVSRGTVDRALNGRPGINTATRERVLETARKYGYRADLLARSLVKGRTMTLGVVVFDLRNQFFAQLLSAIEAKARSEGYFSYLTLTGKDPGAERECLEHLAGRKVDGIILCSVNSGEAYVRYLKELGIPVTTVTNFLSADFPFIGIDERQALRDAVHHIAGRGYTRLVYLSPPLAYEGKSNIYAQRQRFLGCLEAAAEAGLEEPVVVKDKNFAPALDALNLKEEKTVILCSSDIYALEAVNYCRERKLEVPVDLGIMGFDNIDALKYIRPSISTVAYPVDEIGGKAVECVLAQIRGGKPAAFSLLGHSIKAGESL
ncbi:MAG: LacI family DNA-binding transcriptional regulator [Bacillota bacterium]